MNDTNTTITPAAALILGPNRFHAVFDALRALDGLNCTFLAEFHERNDGPSTRVWMDAATSVFVARGGVEERYPGIYSMVACYRGAF